MGSPDSTGAPKWSSCFFLPNLPFPVSSSQSVATSFDQWLKPKNSSHLWFLFPSCPPCSPPSVPFFLRPKKLSKHSASLHLLYPPSSKPTPSLSQVTTKLLTSCLCSSLSSPLLSPQPVWASVHPLLWPFNGFPLLLEQNTHSSPWLGMISSGLFFQTHPIPLSVPLTGLPSVLNPPAGLCLPLAFHSTGSF